MLDRVSDREEVELVNEVAAPVVSRVIGSFIGTPEEDDQRHVEETNMVLGFGDEDLRPTEEAVVEMMTRAWNETMEYIAERRANPGMNDLMDVLVHSEVDGEQLSDTEIFMGLGLLGAAGNDSTRSVFTNGMLGLFENPDQLRLLRDDPSLIEGAVEEFLRMYPAFAHFRRTATRDVELHGQTISEGDKVLLWYVSSNRDESVYADPQRLDVTRRPGPPGVRRGRPALLPRRRAGAARDQDAAHRDAAAIPRDPARGRAGQGALAVPEPAEDAAGPAQRLTRAGWTRSRQCGRLAP